MAWVAANAASRIALIPQNEQRAYNRRVLRSIGLPELVIILFVWAVPLVGGIVAIVCMLRISRAVERISVTLERLAATSPRAPLV
jgi:hypothetical protein